MSEDKIIIIGAGVSGMMAASVLSMAGKKVLILEARDRTGGRILPLSKDEFEYNAEGGAEFIHGEAPITKSLLAEGGLSYITAPQHGEMWSTINGKLVKNTRGPDENPEFENYKNEVQEKLITLKEDLPVAAFLSKYFSGKKYAYLRDWVIQMVQGYDAADPEKMSTFAARDEWMGKEREGWQQSKLIEGYGALLRYLESKCRNNGVEFKFNRIVKSVENTNDNLIITCSHTETGIEKNEIFKGLRVLLTIPLPLYRELRFIPPIPEKLKALSKIGYGGVVKILLRFKTQWWVNSFGEDLSKMFFMFSDTAVPTWWTQYPEQIPVLTGWIPGTASDKFMNLTDEEILNTAMTSLSEIFDKAQDFLTNELAASKVINWPADIYTKGGYSYPTPESDEALKELNKTGSKIYFAGEAIFSEGETGTVESALGSAKETAEQILKDM